MKNKYFFANRFLIDCQVNTELFNAGFKRCFNDVVSLRKCFVCFQSCLLLVDDFDYSMVKIDFRIREFGIGLNWNGKQTFIEMANKTLAVLKSVIFN